MYSWNELKRLGIRGEKYTFHLVCYVDLKEELERVKSEFFGDFDRRESAELINNILTVLEPFLLHQINLRKGMDNDSANKPPRREQESKRPVVMDEHLWIYLDVYNYRLLKKFHEAGAGELCPSGTFSMALVLRSLLVMTLDLISRLGRDGFLHWVEQWLEQYEKFQAPKFREKWKGFEQHMMLLKERNVKYIGLYSGGLSQIHLYHPPPES